MTYDPTKSYCSTCEDGTTSRESVEMAVNWVEFQKDEKTKNMTVTLPLAVLKEHLHLFQEVGVQAFEDMPPEGKEVDEGLRKALLDPESLASKFVEFIRQKHAAVGK
jgi:hypothetical protein